MRPLVSGAGLSQVAQGVGPGLHFGDAGVQILDMP
jgi:hypothetical protein